MPTPPELLLISAVLRTKDHVLPASRGINSEMFHAYKEEYEWIEDYISLHGRAPSTGAFLSAFDEVVLKKVDDVEHFCELVRENHSSKVLAKGLNAVIGKLQAGDVAGAIKQLNSASVAAEASFLGHGSDGDIFRDYEDIKAEVLKRKRKAKETGFAGIPTGFPTLDELTSGIQPGWFVVITARSGIGKALPDKTGVLTPNGYTPIGKLSVGDRVIGSGGKPTSVVGVYPQGDKKVFEVVFSDGSIVEACEDHLWNVQHTGKPWKVQTTRQIMEYPFRRRYAVPTMSGPAQFANTVVTYDPYKLGLILGDGHIKPDGSVTFSNADQELIEVFGSSATRYSEYDYGIAKMASVMRRLGLAGKRSHEKFVPSEYLHSSVKNRHAILQGLLDTDGSPWGSPGGVEYCTTSKQLAEDVQFLAESLGGYASVKKRQTYFTYKGVKKPGKPSYRLGVILPVEFPPFRLSRKLNKYKAAEKYLPKRTIKEVRPTNRYEPMTCIAVESPDSLFVTEHAIVTHNTRSLVRMACAAAFSGYTVQYDALEQGRPEIAMQVHSFTSSEFGHETFKSLDLAQGKGFETNRYLKFLQDMRTTVQGKMHVADTSKGSITQATMAAQIEKNKVDMLLLDYITLVEGVDDHQSAANLSSSLKRMANKYKVPVITAAQINRTGSGKAIQGLEDIGMSDRIGQDADLVINVQKFCPNVVTMRVVKFRHGPEGQILYLKFDPNQGVMEEITYEQAMDLKDEAEEKEVRTKERKFTPRKKGSFHEAAIATKNGKKPVEDRRTPQEPLQRSRETRGGTTTRKPVRTPQRGSSGGVRLKRPS